jgi:transcriptional regulator with XRE-family HTH domain
MANHKLGDAIRERRLALGWTQGKLADEAHVSRKHVSSLELGKADVSVGIVTKIAQAMEMANIPLGDGLVRGIPGEGNVMNLARTIQREVSLLVDALGSAGDTPRGPHTPVMPTMGERTNRVLDQVETLRDELSRQAPDSNLQELLRPIEEWILGLNDDPFEHAFRAKAVTPRSPITTGLRDVPSTLTDRLIDDGRVNVKQEAPGRRRSKR